MSKAQVTSGNATTRAAVRPSWLYDMAEAPETLRARREYQAGRSDGIRGVPPKTTDAGHYGDGHRAGSADTAARVAYGRALAGLR